MHLFSVNRYSLNLTWPLTTTPTSPVLRRSSLTIGVVPGCPVCVIVAASLVAVETEAVETDVGEIISAAKVAFVCGLWSVGVAALLSAGPFSYFCVQQLLFPCLEVLVQSASPHHAVGCTRCWCQVLSCPFYRHPCSTAMNGLWFSFQMPTLHRVGLFVGCLTSQQQAGVSQGRISDKFTCCHTEIEAAEQTFYLTQSQYTDTGPTSPSADPITPGAWQGSHWSANF